MSHLASKQGNVSSKRRDLVNRIQPDPVFSQILDKLERAIDGPWDPHLSPQIDWLTLAIESGALAVVSSPKRINRPRASTNSNRPKSRTSQKRVFFWSLLWKGFLYTTNPYLGFKVELLAPKIHLGTTTTKPPDSGKRLLVVSRLLDVLQ